MVVLNIVSLHRCTWGRLLRYGFAGSMLVTLCTGMVLLTRQLNRLEYRNLHAAVRQRCGVRSPAASLQSLWNAATRVVQHFLPRL